MSADSERELLRTAAEESCARLRHDRARATDPVKRLLVYLEPHLFDPQLNVNRWKRESGVRTSTLDRRFRQELGCSPLAYITRCRMETAAWLLTQTDLSIARIALLIGILDSTVFSRTFVRWSGVRPSKFRRQFQRPEVSSPDETSEHEARLWRLALVEEAKPEERTQLTDRLIALCPELRAAYRSQSRNPLPETEPERPETERIRAENIWETLRHRSFGEQRILIRRQAGFATRALFDLLRHKSRVEGRTDRRRGVELAELGLASLELYEGGNAPSLRVLGRVWLANALRLALDYHGAERELALAEAEWEFVKDRDRAVEAELCHYKAAFRWFQRRYPEALELANRAVELNRAYHRPVALAQSLIQQAAVWHDRGDVARVFGPVEEAIRILEDSEEHYLLSSSYSQLAASHIHVGNFEDARQALGRAEELIQKIGHPLACCQILWLRARLHEGLRQRPQAVNIYRQARTLMMELGERGHAVVLSLELAMLLVQEGQLSEAQEILWPTIAILDALDYNREAVAARKLLRLAIRTRVASKSLRKLREAHTMVTRLLTDPTIQSIAVAAC